MTNQRLGSVAIAAMLLAACGSADDATVRPQPPPVEDTAFGDLAGKMDKARGVQDTIMQDKQALDRALQEQTGGDQSAEPAGER